MSRTRAGAPAAKSTQSVSLSDNLLRQLGRIVIVDNLNALFGVAANPLFISLGNDLTRQLGHVTLVKADNTGIFDAAVTAGWVQVTGTVKAREETAAMTWVDGAPVAPAANAVVADTGALAAGDYDFNVLMTGSDATITSGKILLVQHRDAANAATLHTLAACPPQASVETFFRRYTLALNERLRVVVGAVAGAAGSQYHGAIGRRVS